MFLTPIHTIFYKKKKKKILIGFVIIPIKMYLFKPHLISNHSNTLKEVFFFKMNKNDGKFHILTKNKKGNFCGGSHIHYVYQLTNYLVWHFQRRFFNGLANQKQELHVWCGHAFCRDKKK